VQPFLHSSPIDGTVSDRHELAGRQRCAERVPVVGVDADEVDDEERRETDEEPDRDGHRHLDDAQFRRDSPVPTRHRSGHFSETFLPRS